MFIQYKYNIFATNIEKGHLKDFIFQKSERERVGAKERTFDTESVLFSILIQTSAKKLSFQWKRTAQKYQNQTQS